MAGRITIDVFHEELEKRGLEQSDFVKINRQRGYPRLSQKIAEQGRLFSCWATMAVKDWFKLYDLGEFDNV